MTRLQLNARRDAQPYLSPDDIKKLKAQADEMSAITARAPAKSARSVFDITQMATAYWANKRLTHAKKGA